MLLIMCFAADIPIGYGLAFDVAEHPFMPEWQRSGYITQIFVTSEYRKQGVGQAMVKYIIRWLTSRGVTHGFLIKTEEAEIKYNQGNT
jgi:GNAT superfamily N-acetyltransferase